MKDFLSLCLILIVLQEHLMYIMETRQYILFVLFWEEIVLELFVLTILQKLNWMKPMNKISLFKFIDNHNISFFVIFGKILENRTFYGFQIYPDGFKKMQRYTLHSKEEYYEVTQE